MKEGMACAQAMPIRRDNLATIGRQAHPDLMGKAQPIRSRVGAFSSSAAIMRADGRSSQAQLVRRTVADLTEQLGGADRVTAAQRLLIESAAVLHLRLRCIFGRYEAGQDEAADLDARTLAMVGGLRKTLQVLGLEHATMPALSLATYLENRRAAGE